jgi:hypothetical protein
MEITFVRGQDGAPYPRLSGDWFGFNETLADAVGSSPPRGSDEQSVSTYWIDRAERIMRQLLQQGHSGVIQGGNATTLLVRDSKIVATSDYELFDDEQMDPKAFHEILAAWRDEVAHVRETESPVIEQTYRRVPYPD